MYIERDIKERFGQVSSAYNLVAVVGPRQAGKTTFLKERVRGTNAAYLVFDDPDVRALFDEDVKRFENQYLEGHDAAVLDEVQYGKEAGRKLKYLADKGRKLWITSSSQTLLGKEVLSWLVGRVSIVRLYPFSFSEFMKARGQKEATPAIIKRSVWEHQAYGGYPKVVLSDDPRIKETLLRDLYETMVLKDVARTFGIEDIRSLEAFSHYLSHSVGNVIVYGKVSSQMGISFQTVKKYLDAMEMSYLVVRIRPFFTNKLKELTKQPKVYFIDTGLRNAIANEFNAPENDGKLFENYILGELLKMNLQVKYWQTKGGAEVDFVVEKEGTVIPVEVKLNVSAPRAERSLRAFISAYKPKLAVVVFHEGMQGEIEVDGCRVIFTDTAGLAKAFGW